MISVKSPTLWSAIGVATGKATKIAELPLAWTAAGIAGLASIEVMYNYIDHRNKKRALIRKSPFAYVCQAEAEGII